MSPPVNVSQPIKKTEDVANLVGRLNNPQQRDLALTQLAKHRNLISDLGPIIWLAPDTITSLTHCIVIIYPNLAKLSSLTIESTNRACGVLALFQILVSHPTTKQSFLEADLLRVIFPLLEARGRDLRIDCLRITALGVVAALLKSSGIDSLDPALVQELKILCIGVSTDNSQQCRLVLKYIMRKLSPKSKSAHAEIEQAALDPTKDNRKLHVETVRLVDSSHYVWGDVEKFSDSASSSEQWVSPKPSGDKQHRVWTSEPSSPSDQPGPWLSRQPSGDPSSLSCSPRRSLTSLKSANTSLSL